MPFTTVATATAIGDDATGEAQEIKTEQPATERPEKKVYGEATLEDNFAEDVVMVVLDQETGGINKKHDPSFFGDYKEENIQDLTEITGDVKSKKYLNTEKFHQIFRIKLPKVSEKTEEMQVKQSELEIEEKIGEGFVFAG